MKFRAEAVHDTHEVIHKLLLWGFVGVVKYNYSAIMQFAKPLNKVKAKADMAIAVS
ncbi:hypothetical protein GLO73106DRAFT_00040560 [Gloeocapsa sp. PCC 73106]|nr:hypothetical protein GLO73106DRAFT_00040560 [Gloeocapsa sp. PCC 73106]